MEFPLLLGTTVAIARLGLQGSSCGLFLSELCSEPLESCKVGEVSLKILVKLILLEGICCLAQWIRPLRKVNLDLMR